MRQVSILKLSILVLWYLSFRRLRKKNCQFFLFIYLFFTLVCFRAHSIHLLMLVVLDVFHFMKLMLFFIQTSFCMKLEEKKKTFPQAICTEWKLYKQKKIIDCLGENSKLKRICDAFFRFEWLWSKAIRREKAQIYNITQLKWRCRNETQNTNKMNKRRRKKFF